MSDHKRRKIRAEPLAPGACILCKSMDNDEFRFGKFYKYQNISAHYYCVLFACALPQNGRNSREGIKGFLTRDIIHESNRGARLRCSYCGQMGATVGCCLKKCKKVFHFPCGVSNGVQNQFFGPFCSYCEDHKSKQKIKESDFEDEVLCTVCYGAIEFEDRDSFLKAPCCVSNCFHRECIQRYALSAGYFFKCTLCNDKSQFEKEMLRHGIHIPKQDASWEKERNAYQELLVRAKCDASQCQCPKGRQENKESSLWHLVYCEDCGSTARHVGCEKLLLKKHVEWRCSDCLEFTKKLTDKRKTEKKARPHIAQAGTSSSGSQCSRSKGESKQVRKLLKKCKSCVVKLKMLGYNDMPASVKQRYKHLLRDLKKAASTNTKPSFAVKTSKKKCVKRSKRENVEVPKKKGVRTSNRIASTQNQYANLEHTTSEIFTKPSRSSSATRCASHSLRNKHVKTNEVIDSCQKRVIKQTSIEGFLRNQVNGAVSGRISRSDLFLEESKRMQNKRKRDASSNCLVKQISETVTSTSVASTKENSSVISQSSVLIKVTKTVNFYCKGIENFFQGSVHYSPEKTLHSLESGCKSSFKQAVPNYISPQPSSSSGIYTSTDKNGITVNREKQVREMVQAVQRLPAVFKKNRISKVICSKNQIFKKIAIKTYSHSTGIVTNNSISTSGRPRVYIDQRYIADVHVVDKNIFDHGIPSVLSIELEDCLKPPSKALANKKNSGIPCFNGTYLNNSDDTKEWGNCSFNNLIKQAPTCELLDLHNVSSHPTMTHQNLKSTTNIATSSFIAENLHDKTDCLEPEFDTKWPVVVKLTPDDFCDQVVHKQVPAIGVVWSKQCPLPVDTIKLCFPISPLNGRPLNPTTQPVLTIPRDIVTNFTNILSKNRDFRSSTLPAICHQTMSALGSKNLMSTVSKIPPPMSTLRQRIMSNVANSLGKIQSHPNSTLQSICYQTKDALKAQSPIPTVPKMFPQVPMSILHQRIMSNVENCLSKNQNRPNSTLAAIRDQENDTSKGKNTLTEKYLHMSGSGPKQTTNNEKRKKRMRFKSGNNDKRLLQSNTLFSYFCPL